MAHIVIADDEDDVREFLLRAVRRYAPQAEVTAVVNGAAALEIMRQRGCDLLISDHRMPVMTGVELLQAVRESQPILPVVIISADMTAETGGRRGWRDRVLLQAADDRPDSGRSSRRGCHPSRPSARKQFLLGNQPRITSSYMVLIVISFVVTSCFLAACFAPGARFGGAQALDLLGGIAPKRGCSARCALAR